MWLDIVLGEIGLVEPENEKDLKEMLRGSIILLSDLEKESTNLGEEDDKSKFAVFIKGRRKTILRKLIRSVRRKTFRIPESTASPKLSNLIPNLSENINSFLSAKKATLRYKKKEDISKFDFMKKVLQPSISHQRREIERAVISQSNEYCLNKKAEYLQVQLESWTILSMKQNIWSI